MIALDQTGMYSLLPARVISRRAKHSPSGEPVVLAPVLAKPHLAEAGGEIWHSTTLWAPDPSGSPAPPGHADKSKLVLDHFPVCVFGSAQKPDLPPAPACTGARAAQLQDGDDGRDGPRQVGFAPLFLHLFCLCLPRPLSRHLFRRLWAQERPRGHTPGAVRPP